MPLPSGSGFATVASLIGLPGAERSLSQLAELPGSASFVLVANGDLVASLDADEPLAVASVESDCETSERRAGAPIFNGHRATTLSWLLLKKF